MLDCDQPGVFAPPTTVRASKEQLRRLPGRGPMKDSTSGLVLIDAQFKFTRR
jgi:hypothetical protein